jgi:hypothetical protein
MAGESIKHSKSADSTNGSDDWELEDIGGSGGGSNTLSHTVDKLVARMDALETENKLLKEKMGSFFWLFL